jgi:hypothetical protein
LLGAGGFQPTADIKLASGSALATRRDTAFEYSLAEIGRKTAQAQLFEFLPNPSLTTGQVDHQGG